MTTWQSQHPELWDRVTKAFGEGWWDQAPDELYNIMVERRETGKCAFCGKRLSEKTFDVPSLLSHGPFCSEACAGDEVQLYCIMEGK